MKMQEVGPALCLFLSAEIERLTVLDGNVTLLNTQDPSGLFGMCTVKLDCARGMEGAAGEFAEGVIHPGPASPCSHHNCQ